MNAVEVYKFGGASVRDAAAIRNVAQILKSTPQRPLVIVISAMGKTTNALENIIHEHYKDPAAVPGLVNTLKAYHEEVALALMADHADPLLTDLHDLWVELNWILEEEPHPDFNYQYDQIIVFGELAATKIVSAFMGLSGIQHQWLDARSLIKTDAVYRDARILWDMTQSSVDQVLKPSLAQYGMAVTQGFIGSTVYNESTSLGREGSDYTAAILAYTLDAASVTIWKDVPGIMTGDPKRFENVARLEEISYLEAIEMTYYGAKVIHPKTIKPLQNKNIPMFVRPFDHPEKQGTRISGTESPFLPPIVVVESDQALLEISTRDFSFVAEEHLSEIFSRVAALRIKVNSMRNTALSFMMCVRNEKDKLTKLQQELISSFHITIHEDLELITVRHANQKFLDQLEKGKEIILEEKFGDTDQYIVRNV